MQIAKDIACRELDPRFNVQPSGLTLQYLNIEDQVAAALQQLELADKVIRSTKQSIYDDLKSLWAIAFWDAGHQGQELEAFLRNTAEIRKVFYQKQINNDITSLLHDHTVLVTFDGINGAGKTTLAKAVGKYLLSLDSGITEGKSALFGIPLKTSEFLGENLIPEIEHHLRKSRRGERVEHDSLELDLFAAQYQLALTRLAYELPPLAIFDRSYVGTLAKTKDFLQARRQEYVKFIEGEEKEDLLRRDYAGLVIETTPADKISIPAGMEKLASPEEIVEAQKGIKEIFRSLYPRVLPDSELERRGFKIRPVSLETSTPTLRYLLEHIKDKYVIADLAVIMSCDEGTSQKRQQERKVKTKRKSSDVKDGEIEWYTAFQRDLVIPNALYVGAEESLENQFRRVIHAVKERFEDKPNHFSHKITEGSISRYIKENHAIFTGV